MMFQAIKKLFGQNPPPQKMAGATFTILGPLPSMGNVYALERVIRDLKLTGWMRLANKINIEMEVYGTFQAISELLQMVDRGGVLQNRAKYEMMWLPYQNRFTIFSFNIFDRQTACPR